MTFVPCFIWIFAGAPYVERVRKNPLLSAALSCITAAVVGCVLNLAIWFALHTLFREVTTQSFGPLRVFVPNVATLQVESLLITIFASVLLFWLHRGLLPTLAGSIALSLALWAMH